MLLATYALWRRDIVRFLRQRSRIAGALGTPVVFWILLGSGVGRSFTVGTLGVPAGGYLEYFYPGTLALILLFTAIFSTISVIEDRHEGFLQGVLVAPAPRLAIVLGKVLGGTTLALLQAAVFLLLAPLANTSIPVAALPLLVLVLAVFAFALTGLGFAPRVAPRFHPGVSRDHEPRTVPNVVSVWRGISIVGFGRLGTIRDVGEPHDLRCLGH